MSVSLEKLLLLNNIISLCVFKARYARVMVELTDCPAIWVASLLSREKRHTYLVTLV